MEKVHRDIFVFVYSLLNINICSSLDRSAFSSLSLFSFFLSRSSFFSFHIIYLFSFDFSCCYFLLFKRTHSHLISLFQMCISLFIYLRLFVIFSIIFNFLVSFLLNWIAVAFTCAMYACLLFFLTILTSENLKCF